VSATPAAPAAVAERRRRDALDHGAVVIAAITSCTNTSNPERDDRRRPAREEGVERGLTRSRG
jgi:aconitate hydratase